MPERRFRWPPEDQLTPRERQIRRWAVMAETTDYLARVRRWLRVWIPVALALNLGFIVWLIARGMWYAITANIVAIPILVMAWFLVKYAEVRDGRP